MADVLERAVEKARQRSASVIRLPVKAIEHSASELQPDPSRSPAAQSPSGFRRRI